MFAIRDEWGTKSHANDDNNDEMVLAAKGNITL